MTIAHRSGRVGWLVAMGVIGLGFATGIAMAGNGRPAPPGAPSPPPSDLGAAPAVSVVSQDPEDVLAYWTPERIAEADRYYASTDQSSADPAQSGTSTTIGPPAPENRTTAPVESTQTIPLAREQLAGTESSSTTRASGPEVSAPPGTRSSNP